MGVKGGVLGVEAGHGGGGDGGGVAGGVGELGEGGVGRGDGQGEGGAVVEGPPRGGGRQPPGEAAADLGGRWKRIKVDWIQSNGGSRCYGA